MVTKRDIYARLIQRGTTLHAWSFAHGYKPRTVLAAVDRWSERDDQPRGRLTYQILRDLSLYTGVEIVPNILTNPMSWRLAA